MIVTGCEPTTTRLHDEAFWPGLAAIIDWAEHHTVSTIWSCLAAHAAVLHLDGIERRPLGCKRSGVFPVASTREHALLAGGGPFRNVPHSRLNDLEAADLAAHGYVVLTQSASAGVDMFVKQWGSLFVYLQGHPEYDAAALAREYRRDIARFPQRHKRCLSTGTRILLSRRGRNRATRVRDACPRRTNAADADGLAVRPVGVQRDTRRLARRCGAPDPQLVAVSCGKQNLTCGKQSRC